MKLRNQSCQLILGHYSASKLFELTKFDTQKLTGKEMFSRTPSDPFSKDGNDGLLHCMIIVWYTNLFTTRCKISIFFIAITFSFFFFAFYEDIMRIIRNE